MPTALKGKSADLEKRLSEQKAAAEQKAKAEAKKATASSVRSAVANANGIGIAGIEN